MYSKTQIFVWRYKNFQNGILTDMLKLHEGRLSYLALRHGHFYSTLLSVARWTMCVCQSLSAMCHTVTMLVWSYIPFSPTSYTFHCVIHCRYINLYTLLNIWYFKYSAHGSTITHVQFLLHTHTHTHTRTRYLQSWFIAHNPVRHVQLKYEILVHTWLCYVSYCHYVCVYFIMS
jgi:hypothetical protein